MSIAKRDFGSFHASNVQELINLSEDEYEPPSIPEEVAQVQTFGKDCVRFGRAARDEHFCIKDDIFLNHGAFGAVLKPALLAAQKWQFYIETQPVRFIDRELFPQLVSVTRRLASFVGCEPQDLVLVQNVSTALNVILRSLPLKQDDVVFSLSIEYDGVKKMVKEAFRNTGAVVQEEQVNFPLVSEEQILRIFEERLQVGTRVVIFDHISSRAPFTMPVQKISAICRRKCPDARIIVDGAHALLAQPLCVADLDVDFYTSNCHKWFSGPKGTAFMYVRREHQQTTRPLVVSHGWGSGFNSEYIWQGLRDYSGFLALNTVLEFWTAAGVESVRDYTHQLAREAADLLCGKWNSTKLTPDEMNGCMLCVQLPRDLYACQGEKKVAYKDAEKIQNLLYHRFHIEVPIKSIDGDLYVRISAHIYNELLEYAALADAVLALTAERVLHTD